MLRIGSIFIALTSWTVSTIALTSLMPLEAWAENCSQWDIGGHWVFKQSNGLVVIFDLQQGNNAIGGSGRYDYGGNKKPGIRYGVWRNRGGHGYGFHQ